MAQVGDDGYLRALAYLRANLVIDIGKDGLAGRAYLRIVQRTFGFGQALAENLILQLLHLQVGGFHLTLVGQLLTQLFQLQFARLEVQFRLMHTVGRSRSQAVQVTFVAQLHLHAVQLHLGHLHLHLQVAQVGAVVHLQLLQLVALHLLLVELLLVLGFGALQVQFQDGRTYVHTVTPLFVHLEDARIDGRIDNFFESRHHLARGADTDLDGPLVYGRKHQIFLFHACPHQRNEHTEHHHACDSCYTITNQFLVALSTALFFGNFSIHGNNFELAVSIHTQPTTIMPKPQFTDFQR